MSAHDDDPDVTIWAGRLRAWPPADPHDVRAAAAEPETAFRVLFMPTAGVHLRIVAAWQRILDDALTSGEICPTADVERLAYLFVRIGESMIHADLLAGREPDLDLAADLQRSLLT